jgi:hypothetical protein
MIPGFPCWISSLLGQSLDLVSQALRFASLALVLLLIMRKSSFAMQMVSLLHTSFREKIALFETRSSGQEQVTKRSPLLLRISMMMG